MFGVASCRWRRLLAAKRLAGFSAPFPPDKPVKKKPGSSGEQLTDVMSAFTNQNQMAVEQDARVEAGHIATLSAVTR